MQQNFRIGAFLHTRTDRNDKLVSAWYESECDIMVVSDDVKLDISVEQPTNAAAVTYPFHESSNCF